METIKVDKELGFTHTMTGNKVIIYPITTVDNIIDEVSGKKLDVVINELPGKILSQIPMQRLNNLEDVNMDNAINGYVLTYSSSTEEMTLLPIPSGGPGITNLADLSDVITAGIEDGFILMYNSSTNKFEFNPVSLITGPPGPKGEVGSPGPPGPTGPVESTNVDPQFIAKDYWTTAGTKNFISNMVKLRIINADVNDLTLSINGINIIIEAGDELEEVFTAFENVSITGDNFEAWAYNLHQDSPIPQFAIKDFFSGNSNLQRLLSAAGTGVIVANDDLNNDLTYIINAISLSVSSNTVSENDFNDFTQIQVNATGKYRVFTKSLYGSPLVGSYPDTTPPIDVTNLIATSINATSLTLDWTESVSLDIDHYDIYQDDILIGTIQTTNFSIIDLTEKTSYHFKVKSIDTNHNVSTGTEITQITADITAPNNVTNLTVSNVAVSSLTLSWTASASNDIVGYDIYNGPTFVTSVVETTYGVIGLAASSLYTFTVKSKDASNNISGGVSVNATTLAVDADVTPPVVTVSPSAGIYNVSKNVTLSANEQGAVIYYTLDGTTPTESSLVYSSPISITTTATIKYFAKDTAGNPSSIASAVFTIDTVAPSAASVLAINSITNVTAPLSWVKSVSSDVASQELSYSTDGTNFTIAGSVNPTATSYTVTGLTPSTFYTFRIVVIDTAGNRSAFITNTATTNSSAFTEATVSTNKFTQTTGHIAFNTVVGATSYEIYMNDILVTTSPTYNGVNGYYYDPTGLTPGTLYIIKVITVFSGGKSTGAIVSNTTLPAQVLTTDVTDSFNRADGTLGLTESGHYWYSIKTIDDPNFTGAPSSLAIKSNQVWNKLGDVNSDILTSNTKSDNIKVSFDSTAVKPSLPNFSVIFRSSSYRNFWKFGRENGAIALTKVVNTVSTKVATYSFNFTGIALPHRFSVELRGSRILCYINSTLIFDFTDVFNQSGAYHGITIYNENLSMVDNFSIIDLVDAAPALDTTITEVTNVAAAPQAGAVSIKMTWTGATDSYGYDIFVNGVLKTNVLQVMNGVVAQNYTITGLTASTAYSIQIKAKDGSGNISTGVTVSSTTTAS